MKTITFIFAGAMVLLGIFGIMLAPSSSRFVEVPIKPVILGAMLLIWGILLAWYQTKSYRGGAATIIGGFLVGLAAFTAAENLLWRPPVTSREASLEIAAFLIFLVAGGALLIQGHRIHKLKSGKTITNT